ncbi:MAG TPA: dTMP kinase [Stellaceae bacterium]|nr:dTMP kinase [Stellaceae bacterium]
MGRQALRRGRFITFEGGEGAGKSTQLRRLVEKLQAAGITALATREPGGAPGAEEIRKLLVEGEPERWDPVSEALLMVAARRVHLTATIGPALARGEWVVSDRFADSTIAYQGSAGGVKREELEALHRLIAGDFAPDLTLILDLPVAEGLARAKLRSGSETRFERKDRAFHEKLRQGFLEIARREPQRCVVIDAVQGVDAVHEAVLAAVRERLKVKI